MIHSRNDTLQRLLALVMGTYGSRDAGEVVFMGSGDDGDTGFGSGDDESRVGVQPRGEKGRLARGVRVARALDNPDGSTLGRLDLGLATDDERGGGGGRGRLRVECMSPRSPKVQDAVKAAGDSSSTDG